MEISHNGKSYRAKGAFSKPNFNINNNVFLVISYIFLLVVHTNCQTLIQDESSQESNTDSLTKKSRNLGDNVDTKNHCHTCFTSTDSISKNKFNLSENKDEDANSNKDNKEENGYLEDLIVTVGTFTEKYLVNNRTQNALQFHVEKLLDDALNKERYEIAEGIEIKTIENKDNSTISKKEGKEVSRRAEGRALFSTYTYEYRLMQKIKNFVDTHILSINIPKAANLFGFRCE